ncbi:cupin domain-containing protein [Paraliomyxa miuraensis]|uniref:cupin domain-containing protein n=1 Tax=Paraliomyxa miuraensis TaxID=376150 RepID=UPI0022597FED|nr:cupin domain-containing protein [Paraliomyxa miuraensis]MCX4247286.1 cupin domain-containing protein [Paraliomyxa miuraensis]
MVEISRLLPLVAAFGLGACAAAAVQSSASPPAPAPAPAPVATPAPSPPVTPAARAERRIAPNGKARVTILARGLEAFVARLEMDPGAAVPEHRDATEEYIHVLEGSGTITIDDHEYPLAAGDTVYMPAEAKVSFQNGDAPLVGLQVFAGPEPAAKYDAWTPAP